MMNYQLILIRILDTLLSILIIAVSSPLLLFIYSLLYFTSGSPLFFQERVGKNLKKFTLIKFRTMLIGKRDSPSHIADSTKITPIVNIIRKIKIDEIPQFFNFIKGEMSLV